MQIKNQEVISEEVKKKYVEREISLLNQLEDTIYKLKGDEEDVSFLRQSQNQLRDLFMLVVVGEFNSGKSSFINAMLGDKYLEQGVTPTTTKINVIKYSEPKTRDSANSGSEKVAEEKKEVDGVLQLFFPIPWLQDINIVDTPGTNAVFREHQEITEHFLPRSDLVLFVTSSDRAFSDSERAFFEHIKQWNKKTLVVVSKIDLLESEEELEEVVRFVRTQLLRLVGVKGEVFPVSAKIALKAKKKHLNKKGQSEWEKSRFGSLESFILETLGSSQRMNLKLRNPLGISSTIARKYLKVISERQAILQKDSRAIENIEFQLQTFKEETNKGFFFYPLIFCRAC